MFDKRKETIKLINEILSNSRKSDEIILSNIYDLLTEHYEYEEFINRKEREERKKEKIITINGEVTYIGKLSARNKV